jgi:hypothetical protein
LFVLDLHSSRLNYKVVRTMMQNSVIPQASKNVSCSGTGRLGLAEVAVLLVQVWTLAEVGKLGQGSVLVLA